MVLNTSIHSNNLDGLTSRCVASEEEDKEGKVLSGFPVAMGREAEDLQASAIRRSGNSCHLSEMEGHFTGGWEDQGKLLGGGRHELEPLETEGLRGRVRQKGS